MTVDTDELARLMDGLRWQIENAVGVTPEHEEMELLVAALYDATARAEAAEAERDRLREALSHVVAIHDHSMHDADTNADDMAAHARVALNASSQEGGE